MVKNKNSNNAGSSSEVKMYRGFPDDRTPVVKKIDIVCKILSCILAILFLINVHVLVNGGGYDDSKIVPILGIAQSKVDSDSMEPEILSESVIFTKKQSEYAVGDIILYSGDEYESISGVSNPIARVLQIDEDSKKYIVKGDNEGEETSVEIKSDDIIGRVFYKSNSLYGFSKVYNTVLGAAATLLLSFILLIIPDLLMYKKRKAALLERKEGEKNTDKN